MIIVNLIPTLQAFDNNNHLENCRRLRRFILGLLLIAGMLPGIATSEDYSYDVVGRLTSVSYSDGSRISYEYDPGGNVTRIAKAPGALPPDGQIDTPTTDITIVEGDSVDFTGTGGDPDGNLPLTYVWNFDGAAPDSTDEDPGLIAFAIAGVYVVELTVTDALGLADPTPDTVTVTVQVAGAIPPDGQIDTPNSNVTINVGQSVDFTGSGTDPDNNLPLTFRWDFGGGATVSTNEDPGPTTFSTAGTYTVRFTVMDATGLADPTPASVIVTVRAPNTNTGNAGTKGGGSFDLLFLLFLALPTLAIRFRSRSSIASLLLLTALVSHAQVQSPAGSLWTPMESGTDARLYAVWGTAADNVFAVGANGTILHFDGVHWTPMESNSTALLTGVTGYSDTDIYVSGDGATLLHYDGTAWSPYVTTAADSPDFVNETLPFIDVWTAGPGSNLYVITGRRSYMYDGTSWSNVIFQDKFNAFAVVPGTLAGLAGTATITLTTGFGTGASSATYIGGLAIAGWNSEAGWAASETDMFVVGQSSRRFQGTNPRDSSQWTPIPSGTSNAIAIWGASASDVYIIGVNTAGNSTIAHYDGNATNVFTPVLTDEGIPLRGLWGVSNASGAATDIYAVGDYGRIWRFGTLPVVETSGNFPGSGWISEYVNAHTGELVLEQNDYDIGGHLSMVLNRYYASNLEGQTAVGKNMGRNWTHGFEWRLDLGASVARVVSYQGQTFDFALDTGGLWTLVAPLDGPYQLLDTGNNRLSFVDSQGELTYEFEIPTRKLVRILDRSGNVLDLIYSQSNGKLVTVTDRKRGQLLFQYKNGRLVGVSFQRATVTQQVQYEYSNENLSKVIDQNGNAMDFSYTGGPHGDLLSSVTQAMGNTPYVWGFDAEGRVNLQTDAYGNSADYAYQSGTSPTSAVLPDGSNIALTHDAQGRLTSRRSQDGLSQQFEYDAEGRVVRFIDRLGAVTMTAYNAASGKLASQTRPDGSITSMSYTESVAATGARFYDRTGIVETDGSSASFEYDSAGRVLAAVDQAGKRWTYEYDASGNPTVANVPGAGTFRMEYFGTDTLRRVTAPDGTITNYTYDDDARPVAILFPGTEGYQQTFGYDAAGNLTVFTNEAGLDITMDYDANGNQVAVTLPGTAPVTYEYDDMDRPLAVISPAGDRIAVAYNGMGQVQSTTNAEGDVESYGYDQRGRPIAIMEGAREGWVLTRNAENVIESFVVPGGAMVAADSSDNPMGRVTGLAGAESSVGIGYDELGRIADITDGLGGKTSHEFNDARGMLTGMTLADSAISVGYSFNDFGQLMDTTDAIGGVWRNEFDSSTRLSALVDPLGNRTQVAYDPRGLLNLVTLPASMGTISISHHPLGGPGNRSYSDGTSLDYDYDIQGRLTAGTAFDFDYDANGNMNQSNGIVMQYDKADRLKTVELAPGKVITYQYDDRSVLVGVADWMGNAIAFNQSDSGRVLSITRANGVVTNLGYNTDGAVESITEPGIASIILQRDGRGLITSAQRNLPLTAGTTDTNTRSFDHDMASQITADNFDALGRRLTDTARTYDWNLASRLRGFSEAGLNISNEFDAIGLRTARSKNGQREEYVWNYALRLPSISVIRDSAAQERYFVHAPSGDLLYSIEADGSRRFYHYDENGNTVFLTDDAGNVIARYAYTPYGEVLGASGVSDNPFSWGGQRGVMQDSDSGLYYMRARFYDAMSARFVSRDPAVGTSPKRINPYQFAQGNPVSFRDPTGLSEDERGFFAKAWDLVKAKATDVINGGMGVANAIGGKWGFALEAAEAAQQRANAVYVAVRNANNRLYQEARRLTVHHFANERRLRSATALKKPAGFLGKVFASPAFAIFGGAMSAYMEDSDQYVSTTGGTIIAKGGVGVVNTLVGFNPYSAVVVGLSTVLDSGTDALFGAKLGLHEVLNTPIRLGAALAEDHLGEGRSLFRTGPATTRFLNDLRGNRGGLSKVLSMPGEFIIDETPVGDIAVAYLLFEEKLYNKAKSGIGYLWDSVFGE